MNFTKQQLNDFYSYELIRKTNKYNTMADSVAAQRAAGLTTDEYWFVLENYTELKKAHDALKGKK